MIHTISHDYYRKLHLLLPQ